MKRSPTRLHGAATVQDTAPAPDATGGVGGTVGDHAPQAGWDSGAPGLAEFSTAASGMPVPTGPETASPLALSSVDAAIGENDDPVLYAGLDGDALASDVSVHLADPTTDSAAAFFTDIADNGSDDAATVTIDLDAAGSSTAPAVLASLARPAVSFGLSVTDAGVGPSAAPAWEQGGNPSYRIAPAGPDTPAPALVPGSGIASLAASFATGTSGTTSGTSTSLSPDTVTYSGSGLVFDNTYGSGVSATFRGEIIAAENYLQSLFSNTCTVSCDFNLQSLNHAYSGENSFDPVVVSYSAFVNALQQHATTAPALAAAASLANLSDPSHGAGFEVSVGEARILGLAGVGSGTDDTVILNSYYWTASALQNDPGDAEAVLEHEISEGIMGRIGSLGIADPPYWAPMDLFRFTASGQRDFTGGADGQLTYFSTNGSSVYTGLQYHNSVNSSGQFDGFDLADWDQVGADANAHDPFGPGGPGAGDPGTLSATDIAILQALGWSAQPNGIVVAANPTDALQGGPAFTLLTAAPTITDPGQSNLASATIHIANGSGNAVAGDQLSINGVQNGAVGNGVTASWNAATDTLTLSGSATLAVYQTLLGEVSYQDTGTDSSTAGHPQRTVTWTVNDGTNTYSTSSQVTIDRPPTAANDGAADAAGSTLTATASTGVLANDSDLDGDKLTMAGVSDVANGAGSIGHALAGVYGQLTLNADGSYSYVANNSSAINNAPTGSHPHDSFTYTVSDGNGGIATAQLTITIDRSPVVTAANVALTPGQTSAGAASLFTATDPDGNAITTYGFIDTGPGHFVLNGVTEPNNQEIDVSSAQLSQLIYQSGAGVDTLQIRVNDGTLWSNWTSFTVTPAPVVTVAATTSEAIQGGAAIALLTGTPNIADFGQTDLQSATITIVNGSGNAVTSDHLYVNGVQNGSVGNGVTASWNATTDTLTLTGIATIAVYETLLGEVTYQDTGTDLSTVGHPERNVTWAVFDGTTSFDTTSQVTIDRPPAANNDAASDAAGSTMTATAASGVLSIDSDLDGDKLTVTGVSDAASGAGSVGNPLAGVYGHLTLNADGSYSYVANNLSAIDSAPAGSHPQDIFTYTVNDGNGGTATAELTITIDRPPVVTAANVALNTGQTSIAASSLFTASDPDGNTITMYGFMDTGPGHFVLDGVAQPDNQAIDVTAAQLSELTYQSGAGVDTLQVQVNDGTLSSNWATFTVTSPAATVIQTDSNSFGTTSLVEVGDNYFFYPGGGSSGPELSEGGVPIAAPLGPWAPIGAVQTATGYDVVWSIPGANDYTAWSTDSSGNYITNIIGAVPGTSPALESLELTFNQDLNGDGIIGPASTAPPSATVIQTDSNSFGTTSLVEVGDNYFFYPGGGSSGPELSEGGVPIAAPLGPWAPIGAVQTATGYDVVWSIPGANDYTAWSTDSSGNYITNIIGAVPGTSPALESLELTFNQDLNGDGIIGPASTAPPSATVIQTDSNSFGTTSLVEVGDNYFFYPGGGSSGPELSEGGVPIAAPLGPWAPIGAVQTATGYDVVWSIPGANDYTAWSTDSSGNYITNIIGAVPGTSPALESLELTFNQDLNGDGIIGPASTAPPSATVIQTDSNSFGTTSLVEVGDNYFFYPGGGSSGPELSEGGVPIAAPLGPWAPIGAVQTATGYDVVWSIPGANDYTAWSTDSSGNYITNIIGAVPGTSPALESLELTFNQDLNGDGIIGPASTAPPSATVIQTDSNSFGTTSLVEVGDNYFFYPGGGSSGPELSEGGVPIAAPLGPWAPIGAVQTATGYDVVWSIPGANDYTAWSTDSSGNYITNIIGAVPGTSPALESLELTFNQDLNGDGIIGPASTAPPSATVIQTDSNSFGTTSLVEVGDNYFFYPGGGSSGPELSEGGVPIAAPLGPWAPIGAVQTATGYDVVWSIPGANDYTAWSTDSSGNYITNIIGAVPGTSPALESLELTFNQDLNGDGIIGPASTAPPSATVIQTDSNSFGTTSLVEVGDNYFFYPGGGSSGPELSEGGVPIAAPLGPWAPIGAVQTATGYDVVWSIPGANDYTAWSTDSSGNYITNIIGAVPGTSPALESLELTFNQDLNGDGYIGSPTTVINVTGDIRISVNPFQQAATIEAGATLEMAGADTGSVTFAGSTGNSILDHSSEFSGEVFNFTGNGNLSTSDQIDLRDIEYGAGTTASYTGTVNGGILTVSDAQHDTAHIAFSGDYINSTFSTSSDGNGGTLVVDPAVTQALSSGAFLFNELDSTGKYTVSVSPQDGGLGCVGSFTVDAATAANGQELVGWQFNLGSNSVAQTATQSYDVTLTDTQPNGATTTATQSLAVTIGGPGNNTFVFHPGMGADVIANATSSDTIELDGFSSVTSINQLQALLTEAQTGQSQSLFESANGGHDTVIDLGNHDSIILANLQIAALHASHFIIH